MIQYYRLNFVIKADTKFVNTTNDIIHILYDLFQAEKENIGYAALGAIYKTIPKSQKLKRLKKKIKRKKSSYNRLQGNWYELDILTTVPILHKIEQKLKLNDKVLSTITFKKCFGGNRIRTYEDNNQ